MEAHFEMLPADIAAFRRYVGKQWTFRGTILARSTFLGVLIALQFATVPFVLHWYLEEPEFGHAWFWLFGGQLAFWVGVVFVAKVNTNTYKLQFKGSNKEMHVVIDPERLHSSNPSASESRVWKSFEKIAMTADHAFFFTRPSAAYIVPRRAFADREAFEAFVATARRYYDASKAFGDNAYEETN